MKIFTTLCILFLGLAIASPLAQKPSGLFGGKGKLLKFKGGDDKPPTPKQVAAIDRIASSSKKNLDGFKKDFFGGKFAEKVSQLFLLLPGD